MTLTAFLGRLAKVKKTGKGFNALCPAHDDKSPSLSISEGSGRKILLKCFTGCSTDAILAAIGLETKDLFNASADSQHFSTYRPPIVRFNGNGSRASAKLEQVETQKGIEAIYEYVDADGVILYENVRYQPKDFRQRRPDGNGGYIYNLCGIDRVPYRLPDLLDVGQNGKDEVWLTEGEKDADSLRSLGLTATSFKNWTQRLNPYIEGAHAVLFRDHDTSGVKQANDAAKIISEIAVSVKVIDLFEGEPLSDKHGKDVSDWIDARLGEGLDTNDIAEQLAVIVEGSGLWNAETADSPDADNFVSLFTLKSANHWIMEARNRPIPRKLFDELWFEGETAILFADTGKGKSILSVQISESIASGVPVSGFEMTAKAQRVLYFDFELSDKQFETRYSEKPMHGDFHVNHFTFSDNFIRAEIDSNASLPGGFQTFEDYLGFSLEYHLANTQAKILIVDNLTYLRQETERSKDALPLMKNLKRLKSKFGLSILALAHTPKRDLTRPITINDLAGSKMLSNFADSVFAVGESAKDNGVRYLKQIKTRSSETKYHQDNVCVCRLEKPSNFLRLSFMDYGNEREHLRELTENDKAELIQMAKGLQAEGKTQRAIADALGIGLGTVNRYLKG